MDTLQIRLTHGLIEKMDNLVDTGLYSSRSDIVRDAVRRLILDKLVGIVPNTGNTVEDIKQLRTALSKEKFGMDEINRLAE